MGRAAGLSVPGGAPAAAALAETRARAARAAECFTFDLGARGGRVRGLGRAGRSRHSRAGGTVTDPSGGWT